MRYTFRPLLFFSGWAFRRLKELSAVVLHLAGFVHTSMYPRASLVRARRAALVLRESNTSRSNVCRNRLGAAAKSSHCDRHINQEGGKAMPGLGNFQCPLSRLSILRSASTSASSGRIWLHIVFVIIIAVSFKLQAAMFAASFKRFLYFLINPSIVPRRGASSCCCP